MKIVTHDGYYHADDVLAVSVLTQVYPDAEVIRTRDPEVIASADMVVDVGGEYNVAEGRFDHHQKNPPMRPHSPTVRSILETMRNEGFNARDIPYSAFGLIWKSFGRKYIRSFYEDASQSKIDFMWTKIDNSLVLEIDRNDTGLLEVSAGHLATIIWNLNGVQDFADVQAIADDVLVGIMNKLSLRYDARDIVPLACENQIMPGVIVLDREMPWKAHVTDDVNFAIFPRGDEWMIGTVPTPENSMVPKIPLHADWRGLSGDELSEASGIPGCVFVHNSGFVGLNKTKEGALEMIQATMDALDEAEHVNE